MNIYFAVIQIRNILLCYLSYYDESDNITEYSRKVQT